jgi:hypothetical protein
VGCSTAHHPPLKHKESTSFLKKRSKKLLDFVEGGAASPA